MEEKLSGIVVSSISYGENDKILNIFTLEKGIVSAKIKGVKKAGAKL
ncbi:MAG: recombination protein O N-terminal domain-containing protein, partial [Firmicutes bacterium]|nr:recombination protein O N-terminal domain-containing protein [Candidatus Caballimonas caccae]